MRGCWQCGYRQEPPVCACLPCMLETGSLELQLGSCKTLGCSKMILFPKLSKEAHQRSCEQNKKKLSISFAINSLGSEHQEYYVQLRGQKTVRRNFSITHIIFKQSSENNVKVANGTPAAHSHFLRCWGQKLSHRRFGRHMGNCSPRWQSQPSRTIRNPPATCQKPILGESETTS